MTNEEVIYLFEEMWELMWKEMRSTTYSDIKESGNDIKFSAVYNTVIELLKKEHCEDAISRQAVLDEMYKRKADGDVITAGFIKNLPSVNTQEPFMNKPCVAHRICHEDKVKALDKIRAEIEQIEINGHIRDVECFSAGLNVALNVIDKYMVESE